MFACVRLFCDVVYTCLCVVCVGCLLAVVGCDLFLYMFFNFLLFVFVLFVVVVVVLVFVFAVFPSIVYLLFVGGVRCLFLLCAPPIMCCFVLFAACAPQWLSVVVCCFEMCCPCAMYVYDAVFVRFKCVCL